MHALERILPGKILKELRENFRTIGADNSNVALEVFDIIDFHNFAKYYYFIMTNSGGSQEEAPSLEIPVFVLRDTTGCSEDIYSWN